MQSVPLAEVLESRFPRWARTTLALLLLISLTIGVPWCLINAMGRHVWRQTQASFQREGETLDFRTLLSPAISEEQNFCASPRLLGVAAPPGQAALHGEEGRRNRDEIEHLFILNTVVPNGLQTGVRFSEVQTRGKKGATAGRGAPRPADAEEARRELKETAEKFEPLLADLATRLNCPKAQWDPPLSALKLPPPLEALDSPETLIVSKLGRGLRLRAALACREGNAAHAMESVQMLLRLCAAEAEIPKGSTLGSASMALESAVETVWQMSDEHVGSAEQWQLLEKELASINLQVATLRTCRGELAMMVDYIMYARGGGLADPSLRVPPGLILLARIAPDGIFLNNASAFADLGLEHIIRPLRAGSWKEVLRGSEELQKIAFEVTEHRWRNISSIGVLAGGASLDWQVWRSIYHQSTLNQALVACALERYRLAHGEYPDSLEGLTLVTGAPLPNDPLSAQPMQYRRVGDARYQLWCVNLSGVDSGGRRGSGPFQFAKKDGDWVWGFEQ